MSEIITRRSLPHWYVPGAAHFITFRLFGSLPAVVLDRMKEKKTRLLKHTPGSATSRADFRKSIHKQLFSDFDSYLDSSKENLWLAEPDIASMVRGSLYFHHPVKYHLLAYTIMGNHVHLLLIPTQPRATSDNYFDTD